MPKTKRGLISNATHPAETVKNADYQWLKRMLLKPGFLDDNQLSIALDAVKIVERRMIIRLTWMKGVLLKPGFLNVNQLNHLLLDACGPYLDTSDPKELVNLDYLDVFLQQGAQLECRDLDEFTPLFRCARNQRIRTAKFLLDRGANVDFVAPLFWGVTSISCLTCAIATHRNQQMVELLLRYGAKLSTMEDNIPYINVNMVKLLMKAGLAPLDIPTRNIAGITSLSYLETHVLMLRCLNRFSHDDAEIEVPTLVNLSLDSVRQRLMTKKSNLSLDDAVKSLSLPPTLKRKLCLADINDRLEAFEKWNLQE